MIRADKSRRKEGLYRCQFKWHAKTYTLLTQQVCMEKKMTEELGSETVTVHFEGDDPPEPLQLAVEDVVRNTIISAMDERRLVWRENDDGWELVFGDGVPEVYEKDSEGNFVALPKYRTEEAFTGTDGSGDGLATNLPNDWEYSVQSRGVYHLWQE